MPNSFGPIPRQNSANEFAVAEFLNRRIGFTDITNYIARAMKAHQPVKNPELPDILAVERETYQFLEAINENR